MSDTDELRYRISALERDIATYRDALEEHLYETELERIERGHGWLMTFFSSEECLQALRRLYGLMRGLGISTSLC